MRILFVVPYVPSLIRVRPFNFIRGLSQRGHQVIVATPWVDQSERSALDELAQQGIEIHTVQLPRWRSAINCLMSIPDGIPLQSAYSWHPDLAHKVIELLGERQGEKVDVAHVEHLRGVRYGAYIKEMLGRDSRTVPVVWDSVDCISHLFRQAKEQSRSLTRRLVAAYELQRTERYEARMRGQFDLTLVTSETDRRALLQLPPAEVAEPDAIKVLANGVDLGYFCPDQHVSREPATIVLSGKMSYHANIAMVTHFMEEILPLILRERPGVQVRIVGKGPPAGIRSYANNGSVSVTGAVEDIRPYLRRATVAAVPIVYGAGIQNKVLEAMATGTPVVAYPRAVQALEVDTGREIRVAEDPPSFAREVLDLINDPGDQANLGQAGREYVERNHDWNVVVSHLEAIYDELL